MLSLLLGLVCFGRWQVKLKLFTLIGSLSDRLVWKTARTEQGRCDTYTNRELNPYGVLVCCSFGALDYSSLGSCIYFPRALSALSKRTSDHFLFTGQMLMPARCIHTSNFFSKTRRSPAPTTRSNTQ